MPKDLNVVLLLDYYGGLLPQKQRSLVEYYYCDDLSLAEIAENEDITRQGARDSIVRAVKKLYEFEDKVGFLAKSRALKTALNKYQVSQSNDDLKDLL